MSPASRILERLRLDLLDRLACIELAIASRDRWRALALAVDAYLAAEERAAHPRMALDRFRDVAAMQREHDLLRRRQREIEEGLACAEDVRALAMLFAHELRTHLQHERALLESLSRSS